MAKKYLTRLQELLVQTINQDYILDRKLSSLSVPKQPEADSSRR